MTFDEILEQIIVLLKRQGRVSSRAQKLRFDIDNEYLEECVLLVANLRP